MKSRAEIMAIWDKYWTAVEAYRVEKEADLASSRKLYVEWDLDESLMALSPEEILELGRAPDGSKTMQELIDEDRDR